MPPPEMVGMITTVAVKVNPEREDSETRTVGALPPADSSAVKFSVLSPICGLSFARGKNEVT